MTTSRPGPSRPALIVFAKLPVPGEVKTRLAVHVGSRDAARLYRAFLEDALHQYEALDADLRLYLAPSGESVDGLAIPAAATVHHQSGADLGSKMLRAFAETFGAGYERVAIVGTDHPTLPSQFIEQALSALNERRSVVVGPAEDGGYYLLGMNELLSELFRGMNYSHAGVLDETLSRIAGTGARLTVLPLWYDVDTAESLRRLVAEVDEGESVGSRTGELLRELAGSHPWLSRE